MDVFFFCCEEFHAWKFSLRSPLPFALPGLSCLNICHRAMVKMSENHQQPVKLSRIQCIYQGTRTGW